MKEYRLQDWLPTTRKEMDLRGWDYVDVILFSGDAYVDHPSFGAAVIGRILEAEGLKIAIVPQPNWQDDLRDFKKLGIPRLFFGISAGAMDSMVNHYTANKRLRSDDAYTPNGRHGMRPDYPTIVYSRILKRLFPDTPIIVGGIEASMRRLTHYDYWQDKLLPGILADCPADLLIYGMGERPIIEIARRLQQGENIKQLDDIPQTAYNLFRICLALWKTKGISSSHHTKNAYSTNGSNRKISSTSRKNPINTTLSDFGKAWESGQLWSILLTRP